MNALLLALLLNGAPAHVMFEKAKPELTKQVLNKLAAQKVKDLTLAFNTAATELSALYTEKLGKQTIVQSVMVSAGEPDMGFAIFKNDTETFAILLVIEKGEMKVLPRDFK